jgi:ribosome-associated protein
VTGTDQERGSGGIPPSRDTAAAAARAASSKQAQDIVVLNVSDLIVITDHFVICTAGSIRQIRSVVEEIERSLKEGLGVRPARREGDGDAGWWLLDYIDVVVHVFGPEERAFYDLERLWRDAPRLAWEEPDAVSSAR